MVRGPSCEKTKGQHSDASGEQPTQGYSRRPTPVLVYVAICGIVHDPVRSICPVNEATGPPLVVANAEIAFVTVDTDGSLTEVIREITDVAPVDGVINETEVDDRGEHPRKSGMLILYDAQSARSNASAAVVSLDRVSSIKWNFIKYTILIGGTAFFFQTARQRIDVWDTATDTFDIRYRTAISRASIIFQAPLLARLSVKIPAPISRINLLRTLVVWRCLLLRQFANSYVRQDLQGSQGTIGAFYICSKLWSKSRLWKGFF